MLGLFPPNSSVTVFRFEAAAAFMTIRPTGPEPVKATFRISGCSEMAAPTVWPYPCTMLTTPWRGTAGKETDQCVKSGFIMEIMTCIGDTGVLEDGANSGSGQGSKLGGLLRVQIDCLVVVKCRAVDGRTCLEDGTVTGTESRSNFPGEHQEGELQAAICSNQHGVFHCLELNCENRCNSRSMG